MEALRASYGDVSSDSDPDTSPSPPPTTASSSLISIEGAVATVLPPPSLLFRLNSSDYLPSAMVNRVRSFPHIEGNYALHVYIPVHVPHVSKNEMAWFLKKVSSRVPDLHIIDIDIPIDVLLKHEAFHEVALGREFHISLGRTVPIRVHQIGSIITMLGQRLRCLKRFWIDFSKWEVFLNDEQTRSFLSLEIMKGGLYEIKKQIQSVNEVYKLHNLPEFYKDARPHISLAWGLGDIGKHLKFVVEDEAKSSSLGFPQKHIFASKFSGIECRVGSKKYQICRFLD